MLQEVKLMKLVQHPNVVRLYEVEVHPLKQTEQIMCFFLKNNIFKLDLYVSS